VKSVFLFEKTPDPFFFRSARPPRLSRLFGEGDPMQESTVIYADYLATWRWILVGWLHWPEARFAAWVSCWQEKLNTNEDGWRDWFYHEDELHYVLPLLVPLDLAERLSRQRTRRMYNDLAELMFEELHPAIMGCPRKKDWGMPEYDWDAAKKRVEEILAKYGTALPSADHVTSYERRILGE
jgi:hypothetical protein